jgi:hypothetical protein
VNLNRDAVGPPAERVFASDRVAGFVQQGLVRWLLDNHLIQVYRPTGRPQYATAAAD